MTWQEERIEQVRAEFAQLGVGLPPAQPSQPWWKISVFPDGTVRHTNTLLNVTTDNHPDGSETGYSNGLPSVFHVSPTGTRYVAEAHRPDKIGKWEVSRSQVSGVLPIFDPNYQPPEHVFHNNPYWTPEQIREFAALPPEHQTGRSWVPPQDREDAAPATPGRRRRWRRNR